MQKRFKDFINYDKRIGKIIISGDEGTGKTLLLTRIAVGKMLHGLEDCWKSYEKVDEFNSLGFNFSKDYDHLLFSNYPINCKNTEIPLRTCNAVEPFRLGLYDDDYLTHFFPPYSLFCITEGKNYFDSYEWDKFPWRFVGWVKTMRQAYLDMIVDTQYFGDICTTLRRITNRFIYLYKECEEIRDVDDIVVGHKLFVIEWHNNRDVELFESKAVKQNCIEYELIIDECVYDNFDSHFCMLLHLAGRIDDDFHIEKFPEIRSVEDIEEYFEKYGFKAPEGFFKSKKVKVDIKNNVPEMKIEDDFGF